MTSLHMRAAGRVRRPRLARTAIAAGLAALALPAIPMLTASAAMATTADTAAVHDATATLRVVVQDFTDEHEKIVDEQFTRYMELDGHRYEVSDDRLADLAPDSTLRIDGTITDGRLSLSDVTPVRSPAPQTDDSADSTDGTHVTKDLVILSYWTAPDGSYTQASAQAEVANDDAWFREVSYGAEGISATATPWVQIANPGASCDQFAVVDSARAAAAAVGYDFTQYDRTLVYFPRTSCPWAGVSQIGGEWSVFNGSLSTSMTTHEQGHELGFYHAHSYICSDSDGFTTMADWCDIGDYGDPYDTMGKGGAVHYNGAEKASVGWLPDGRLVDLTVGSSTTLAPLEQQTAAPQVAKLNVSDYRQYYIEYRQLLGVDSSLGWDGTSTHGTDGVLIHAVDPYRAGPDFGSLLLDMSPDGNFLDATLKAGESWTSPEGWTINVGSVTSSGAAISITEADATAPSAPRWPYAYPGDGSAWLYWSAPVSDGGSNITSYTVTASPGGQTVTVPGSTLNATVSGLTNGTTYTFAVTATNSIGTSPASDPSNEVTPQGESQTTTYEDSAVGLGGWSVVTDGGATDGSYRSAAKAKEAGTFAFTGTAVTVLARGGPAAGKAKITIDGKAKGTVDLYRASNAAVSLPYAGLTNGAHTIMIKVLGKKSGSSTGTAVNVDGFQVGAAVTADSAPAVAYSGWAGASNAAASGGTYRVSSAKKVAASFTFTGSAVTWVSGQGPAYGKAQVIIDGISRGTFDQYASSPTWQTTRDFTGLSAGQHTITIKALGTKRAASTGTAIVVDALVVTG